jgi:hypothetical protein
VQHVEESNSPGAGVAIVLNRDLLFGSHIRGALKSLGLEPRFVRDTEHFVAALESERGAAVIGVIDMNGAVDWDSLRTALAQPAQTTPTLAFGPHTDAVNRRAAKAAGVSRIVTNGQFQQDMASLIDRYRKK